MTSEVREADAGKKELIGSIDHAASNFFNDARTPWLNRSALDATALGSVTVLTLLIASLVIYFFFRKRTLLVLQLILASLGAAALTHLLKPYFERQRPAKFSHLVEVDGFSYPSGHSLSAAAVYFSIGMIMCQLTAVRRERICAMGICLLIIAIVGLSRMYLGVHYFSDVSAGVLLGIAWAATSGAITSMLSPKGNN